MAITDESSGNGFYMPVAPAYGGGYGSGGMGCFGGDWAWIIILLLAFNGGFGGWGGMGGWGAMGMMDGGFGLYPWLNNSQNINGGFRDQMLNTTLTGIQNSVTSGFGDIQTALCGGFAGVNATVNGAQNALAQQLYTNQIADMDRSFAVQTALSQCCCDNKAGLADVKYTIATENCADRAAISDGIRDIIAAQTAGFQSIKDQLCQDKIDAKNDLIGQLRQELLFSRSQQSQDVQTATIQAGQRALANEVEQYVLPTPRPAYIVGNPNCCYQQGCGCGVA